MNIRVAIAGANGKMGSSARMFIERSSDCEVGACLDAFSSPSAMLGADVLFDATHYEASKELVLYAVEHNMPVVVATSGWSRQRIQELEERIEQYRPYSVLIVPNFSLAATFAALFSAQAASYYDNIEIIESHGVHKIDSPSGTAVHTAERIDAARRECAALKPPSAEQTARGHIVAGVPIHSLRLEHVVAEQETRLTAAGEQLLIRYETRSAEAYEAGILSAIRNVSSLEGLHIGLEAVLKRVL